MYRPGGASLGASQAADRLAGRSLSAPSTPARPDPLPFQTLAYSPPSDRYPPALIAAYGIPGEGEPGELGMLTEVNAVQLTFITENGDKADVTPRKRTIARPLNRPIVVAPFTDSLGLWIAEGVEDALSMYQATGLAAWAAGGATFLPGLADAVPWFVETINVLVDGNEIGRRESAKLADRLHAINRERAEAMRQRGEFPYHFEVPLRELPS